MSLQLHEFRIPFAGMERTVIYHFSDLHLAVADGDSTPDEVTATQKAVSEFDECRRWFAEQYHEPFAVEKTAVDYFEEILAACGDGDAVLCAGDLMERYHPATMRYLDAATAHLPFMTVCGNHDLAEKIPDGYALSAAKAPIQRMELPQLTVLGFDDSRRAITPHQLAALRAALEEDKPLVILMHIPFAVPENEAMLRGCGEYFRLNHDDCPAENEEFIRLITDNAHRIAAVLAGHLHFQHTCPVTDTLTQYVSSQGMCGHVNKYVIGE
ncbi:MAG: metallophosphoesterase [Clostridia bacterium]|nr:metallophosphoesterase [Clostridia bacterium]